jgi:hypothetical protein
MTFRADLELGESYQRKLLELIEYDNCGMSKGCFKPYDVWVEYGGERTTFEVKVDRMTQRTGNIVVEFECNKKPSGITATEADYWVYFIHNTGVWFLIPTEEIKSRIASKRYSRTVKGGDGFRSNMYVFPVAEFEEFRDTYVVRPPIESRF